MPADYTFLEKPSDWPSLAQWFILVQSEVSGEAGQIARGQLLRRPEHQGESHSQLRKYPQGGVLHPPNLAISGRQRILGNQCVTPRVQLSILQRARHLPSVWSSQISGGDHLVSKKGGSYSESDSFLTSLSGLFMSMRNSQLQLHCLWQVSSWS